MRIVFVHWACVRDGSWWWHRTAELPAAQGLAGQAQREFAGRAGSVVELDAGHHAFPSQPAAVRDLILAL